MYDYLYFVLCLFNFISFRFRVHSVPRPDVGAAGAAQVLADRRGRRVLPRAPHRPPRPQGTYVLLTNTKANRASLEIFWSMYS